MAPNTAIVLETVGLSVSEQYYPTLMQIFVPGDLTDVESPCGTESSIWKGFDLFSSSKTQSLEQVRI